MKENNWEQYAAGILRIKVGGGHIYESKSALCFVPNVDLERYASHLRDAYNQGFRDGQEQLKEGTTTDV